MCVDATSRLTRAQCLQLIDRNTDTAHVVVVEGVGVGVGLGLDDLIGDAVDARGGDVGAVAAIGAQRRHEVEAVGLLQDGGIAGEFLRSRGRVCSR